MGAWPANKKVIDLPLHKYLQARRRAAREGVAKDDPDGMRSITLVKVARRLGAFTLLEVTIKTGRTHQIRVHLASQGHPIAGDDKYGDFELNKALQRQGLKRMFLHAWRLQFDHPASGERIALEAPLPPDLQTVRRRHAQPTAAPVRPDRLRLGRHAVRLHADHRALHPARGGRRRRRRCRPTRPPPT